MTVEKYKGDGEYEVVKPGELVHVATIAPYEMWYWVAKILDEDRVKLFKTQAAFQEPEDLDPNVVILSKEGINNYPLLMGLLRHV